MLELKISEILRCGTNKEYLQRTVKENFPIQKDGYVLLGIDRFLGDLAVLELVVTLRAAEPLAVMRKELSECDSGAKLTKEQASRLHEIMDEITPTLFAEAKGMVAYIVSGRRFPIERLVDDVGGLFAKDAFQKLPSISQQDFKEAAKCLAFERATAAAFHMLRGTESALKWYYCSKLHRNRSDLMWEAMIVSMRKYPRRFSTPLVNHLDHIRSSFRNPTAHPEKVYEMDEAQDLLSICIDVGNRIVQQLN